MPKFFTAFNRRGHSPSPSGERYRIEHMLVLDERWTGRDGGIPPGRGGDAAPGAAVRLYRRRAEGAKPLLRLRTHL